MTGLTEEDYVDILEERRNSSDVSFASRNWVCTPCQFSQNRSPQDIKNQVLVSNRLQIAIKKISCENGQSIEEVEKRASEIIDEMAHDFHMKVIRVLSLVLSKFFKQVYGSIFVNKSGIEKVTAVSGQYPILYLPTHRSYADFLLVSYICYHFDLPIPVVASGLDFLGMKFINHLLRKSGAFFIRRSFIDDHLYWEIFSEYVKSHIQGCEYPIEFFIEGTRSRTAKSLIPKTGMLQAILEEYFCSRIPDITVVPISMSYDRTLEETLYAYELLGVPKPKESTKGLIKARKILSTNYSNAYIHFGDPISCKEFFKTHHRSLHNLSPRSFSITIKEEQLLCQDLANYVIHCHQRNLMLSPFPLVCLILGHPWFSSTGGIQMSHLVNLIIWLEQLVKKTGALIYFECSIPEDAIAASLRAHSNIIEISPDWFVSVKFLPPNEESSTVVRTLKEGTLKYAVPSMFMYHYGNQVLQLLIHFCLICTAFNFRHGVTNQLDDMYFNYTRLRKLLQREFVFKRNDSEADFLDALQKLKEEGLFDVSDSTVRLVEGTYEKFNFLRQLPLYFLQSYSCVLSSLLTMEWIDDKEYNSRKLAQCCQVSIEKAINNEKISDYKCLSLDIINNSITFLVNEKALRKEKKNGQVILMPQFLEIQKILDNIEFFIALGEQNISSVFSYACVSSKL